MAGGDKKIHEHPNAGKSTFAQRKGDINRTGLNKKSYAAHIKEIKDKGYSAPTKTEYYDMVGLLLSMDEEDCKDFAQDKERPYWIRLIVLDLNNKNTRQKMMGDYRDWLFGKADSKMTIDGGLEIKAKKDYSNYSTEDLKAILEISKKYEEKK